MRLENSRERNPPATPGAPGKQRRQQDQGLGKDVGHDEIVFNERELLGNGAAHQNAVRSRVRGRGAARGGVDVDRVHVRSSELGGGDRQYTGAAAVVEDALPASYVLFQKIQNQLRARMAACAEGDPGVEYYCRGHGPRLLAPARPDPQPLADYDRSELRLAAPHPILLLKPGGAESARLPECGALGCRRKDTQRFCINIEQHSTPPGLYFGLLLPPQ